MAGEGSPVPLFSWRHVAFFHRVFTRFFGRHMGACRLARWSWRDAPPGVPVVAFANHPSWWDGVAFMLLTQALFPGRPMFSPIDAEALKKYGFMRRIGVFGIETGTPRGAVRFLRTAEEVLATPDHMLWMNAPGRFCDVRERPVPIVPGLTRLPEIAPGAVFVPLALDYPFWTERRAEMLAAFGEPIPASELLTLDRDARAARLSAALAATMDRLAEDAISRDPARFETLVQGQQGMGGIYQGWRRLRALLGGERFDPRHDTSARA
ncbi:MAG TPA: lysophospholipid acyltransferase family protein [Acetobacteraceae bacterium]|nr:lysophospholipid acyltransferase family protein [Acetobacteraceae bacterium]